jgi:hypothetical protein
MIYHDDKVPVQVVVTLWLREEANVQEVISEMDYDFMHRDILDMEINDVITEI